LSNRTDRLQKLYFRIGEVAGIVGVEPHVLRYWESEFRSVRPQKSARGQRIYSRRDVDTLLKVKELLYSHRFTIAGAKRKLREGGVEPIAQATVEAAPEQAPAPAAVVVRDLAEVRALRDRLAALRDKATSYLSEVDGWGTLESPDATGPADRRSGS
jgi:DNA-binding transcriptional MerR regulator